MQRGTHLADVCLQGAQGARLKRTDERSKEINMRKIVPALAFAAAAAASLATPAMAEIDSVNPNYAPVAPVVAGAAVGTAVGVGLYHGWYGSGGFATAAGATAGTAAVAGGIAGVGTIALLEGVTAKCHGFGVLWTPRDECVNGQYVGYAPVSRRHVMR
jgi:hypothetical protein